MTTEEKLKHFLDVTVENANAKSVETIEEYKQGLKKVFESHREDALRKQELQIKLSEENLRKEKNSEVSKQQIEIKKELGKKQEELKSLLFHEVENKLEEYMSTKEYRKYLIDHIIEAKKFAQDEEIQIYIDPADEEALESLEKATGTQISVSEYSFHGGIRAVIRSKNILIDQSFETRLNEAKDGFSFNFD